MTIGRLTATLLVIGAATPALAIVARPPIFVGPPMEAIASSCLSLATPGGTAPGGSVPIPALALGAPVRRAAVSFPTGGGGTGTAMMEAERRAAGLPWQPATFDLDGTALPLVFAGRRSAGDGPPAYERLVLKPSRRTVLAYGLIHARPSSPTEGRIVSVGLTLRTSPAARPMATVMPTRRAGCPGFAPIQVYAPAMSAPRVRRLFAGRSCSWFRPTGCAVADRPRGRVLFVQPSPSGIGYEHRWIDYDALARR